MTKAELETICRELADKGKLIEIGWLGYRFSVLAADAGPVQIEETRRAFFAGAQHLFGSIMSILEPGTEGTSKDLERIFLIDRELAEFIAQFKVKHEAGEVH